ncbi:hypothetical protein JW710_04130 [Candidatus Dojkabacteria bacterium]|nr:hypothetical protein [Candidatus Dojkabacteria bacterium]
MDLLLLPGNSSKNEEWIEAVEAKVRHGFASTEILYYDHWKSGGNLLDMDKEFERMVNIASGLGNYVIFAKSAGTLLAFKGVYEGKIYPARMVFAGTAVKFSKRLGCNIETWLAGCTVPVVFLQKEFDPACNFDDLKKLVEETKMEKYELVKVEGADHHYEDLDLLSQYIVE